MRQLRLGTRGSALARAQSGHVADAVAALTGAPVELVIIRTRGDEVTDRPLGQVGGKGLFTKEIEDAMLRCEVDLAVHSLKDLPTETPAGLVLGAHPRRADPRDVLVGVALADLPPGAKVGTGSGRRRAQLLAARPDLQIEGIRGNVDTRVGKQQRGEFDAILLAAAGLLRLGKEAWITEALPVDLMVPAVGQGALAVQCREDDADVLAVLARLDDPATRAAVEVERAWLAGIGGGCSVPTACHAWHEDGTVHVAAFHAWEDGRTWRRTWRCGEDPVGEVRAAARALAES